MSTSSDRQVTEIVINENGDETHESWIRLITSKVSSTPGARLFDSEITHSRYVTVKGMRCTRERKLNSDYFHTSELLFEVAMSEAQWGAFVSSFGEGNGVSATLTRFNGVPVPGAPFESRLEESHREVRDAGAKALAQIQADYDKLVQAFEEGAGKKAMRERVSTLGHSLRNAPSNMQFAAESLTEHAENVVTKARADIEAMMHAAAAQHQLADTGAEHLLGPGDTDGA